MRTANSIKNILLVLVNTFIITLLSFVTRKIFVSVLSSYHLGLRGLFGNLISMLSLAELGIGAAIAFSLYKPIAENDIEKIKVLMKFYRKVYTKISLSVFILGLTLSFFLQFIVRDPQTSDSYLRLVFFLFLSEACISYLIAYKQILINAYQKGYRLIPFTTSFKFSAMLAQAGILIITHNFILYLLTNTIIVIIENVVVNAFINKEYPFLKQKNVNNLRKEDEKAITKNVRALIFHKIGDYVTNGTDNIIISIFINVNTVGLYSNYGLIIQTIQSFLLKSFSSITSSFGNLIAKENEDKQFAIFKTFNFLGFWIYCCTTTTLFNTINHFIGLWLGYEYIIDQLIINVVLLDFFLVGMRIPVGIIKASAGVFTQDKYIPVIQAVVNLAVSIVLAKSYGLIGVFIGTLVSSLAVPCWYRPIIIYKYVFKKKYGQYFTEYLNFIIVLICSIYISKIINNYFFDNISYMNLIGRFFLTLFIVNLLILVKYSRTPEFQTLVSMFKKFAITVLNKKNENQIKPDLGYKNVEPVSEE